MSLFAIIDSNGMYVDKNSIRQESDTKEWRYIAKIDYKYDRSRPRDTGRHLYDSVKEANEIIDHLKKNLHKVNIQTDFTIVKVN